jgi:hypothetical protein
MDFWMMMRDDHSGGRWGGISAWYKTERENVKQKEKEKKEKET